MLGLKSVLNVIDNTGVTRAELINVYKVKTKAKKSVGTGTVGDMIKVVVKKSRTVTTGDNKPNTNRLRKGDMAKAVIVRCKKSEMRPDGTQIRFDDSACVLLNNKGEMMGSRVSGPVSQALKDVADAGVPGGRWAKILSIAPKVL
ncbi:putative mitochondrial 54S ribosomal protein YmL38/YmL34 [Kockovaella imperatae]|uniref:Putative mitochondrial 54S ribosomal protein YmL38/YmL34 n=1 Tax=Kockovaella imperatae TaxID=4999 RepID=A0A1Y1UD33_9TREE|nr:putative mitochondrial 54S ribosomal protein YmL38/YmL34 [Kockovaella imperatae]ORX35434.1 putative mitochondrial 54S ribosomal protein YmL38/YmL34 [Kockovaella imperatae]